MIKKNEIDLREGAKISQDFKAAVEARYASSIELWCDTLEK